VIIGEGVVEEGLLQLGEIEAPGEGLGLVRRQFDQAALRS
jgi:hypothetical protein